MFSSGRSKTGAIAKARNKMPRRLLALGLGAAIAFTAAEILIRGFGLVPYIGPLYQSLFRLSANPALGYELAPYRADDGAVATNQQGRRDINQPARKAPNVFRIAVLGDSVAFGMFVRLHEAFPRLLQAYLNRLQKDRTVTFEVFNYGVPGYNVVQTTESYAEKAVADEPDLVVLSYCLNDPEPFSMDVAALKEAHSTGASFGRAPYQYLLDHSYVFKFLWYEDKKREARKAAKPKLSWRDYKPEQQKERFPGVAPEDRYLLAITEEYWWSVESSLAKLKERTDASRTPVVLAVLPIMTRDMQNYPFTSIHAKAAEEARRHGFVAIDVYPPFAAAIRGGRSIELRARASDSMHPSALGHRLVAWSLAVELVRGGLLPVEESAYQERLFSTETPFAEPSTAWFAGQDMVYAEIALRLAAHGPAEQALFALRTTHALNPRNRLVGEICRRLVKKRLTAETRQRLETLMEMDRLADAQAEPSRPVNR